jgi:hypothetical protein
VPGTYRSLLEGGDGMLTWLPVALRSVVALSVVFGLVVAAVLGRISREVSEIVEDEERELWATVPLARERTERNRVTAPKSVWPHRDVLARK